MRNLSLVSVALVASLQRLRLSPPFTTILAMPPRRHLAPWRPLNSSGWTQWLLDHDDLGLLRGRRSGENPGLRRWNGRRLLSVRWGRTAPAPQR